MLLGLGIIIFGYWIKWSLYSYSIVSNEVKENLQKFREKISKGEKVSLNQRLNIWFIDGNGVKISNKVGLLIITIGIVVLILSKSIN